MQKKWWGAGPALLFLSMAAFAPTPVEAQAQAQQPARPAADAEKKKARETPAQNRKGPEGRKVTSCTGRVYSVCIRPGDKLCLDSNGEYNWGACDDPVEVSNVNIDNIVASVLLKDPPCTQPRLCRRVDVNTSFSSEPPDWRCRDKVAVCTRIFY